MMPTNELQAHQDNLEQALLACNRASARAIIQQIPAGSLPHWGLVDTLIMPVLDRIGSAWEEGRVALSQVYMSGRICEELLDILFATGFPQPRDTPRIAIAVLQDYHVLGKRIVCSVLRASGYAVLDYGHGIKATDLVQQVLTDRVAILLISTLMLPSAYLVQDVCTHIKQHNPAVKVVVGGAPFRFDEQLWQHVGADAMGRSATDALRIVANCIAQSHT